MKRNVIVPFLVFCSIAVILALTFSYGIGRSFDGYKGEKLKGQYVVNANDIMASIRDFLESHDSSALTSILENYGYDLVLYDINGRVLFSSANSGNLESSDDINSILSRADDDSKILLVNSKDENAQLLAIAVIDTRIKGLDPDEMSGRITELIWSICSIFAVLAALVLSIIYFRILRPFGKLQRFTGEIAKGNLDVALPQDRQNLFGAFTWAFDMLRTELKASRERVAEAENTKKELVAALSHDIRTPVASIKAYAECLNSLPDKNTTRADRYVEVIIKKTDELTKLSGDMFMHAIMDLEKLEIILGTYASRELFNSIFEPLILQYGNRIMITSAIPDAAVSVDRQRLAQVCENIIANSAKYSPDKNILITACIRDGMLKCSFKDFGQGVLPEDIPFLFDKFFRGKNAKESGQPGSGLGLYISRYIIERCEGEITASNWHENDEQGFLVEISLKIIQI